MKLSHLARRAGSITAAVLALSAATAAGLSVQVARSGWSWGNPQPQGNSLTDVSFLDGRGYAVGAAGTALRSDDQGATWSGLATGTAANLTRLQIVDPDTLVVLGGDGCALRRSADGGATFHKIFIVAEANCPDRVQSFFFTSPSTGYLMLRDGSVLKTSDGGQSFSKQTALPGTPASATGGAAVPADVYFTGATSGLAFITPQGQPSLAYTTSDSGISWKPLTTADPGAVVTRLYPVDAKTIYAVGPNTLLRSTDGGTTFTMRAIAGGHNLTSIHCADPKTCLLTTADGTLLRTTDGGDTATTITAASVPLAAAAFATATRAVGVGQTGETVLSNDAGVNYTPLGGDIGGSFAIVRPGPLPTMALAPGMKGQIALTTDAGAQWGVLSVPTSADIRDTSWTDAATGYALDARGGLFRTANSGQSWQTLSPGAGPGAQAVEAPPGGGAVVLIGPRGVKRSLSAGPFMPQGGRIAGQFLDAAQMSGQTITAWGAFSRSLAVSGDGGASWRVPKLPGSKHARVAVADFLTPSAGYVFDSSGRLWSTATGGRRWQELPSVGAGSVRSMTFGTPQAGFLIVDGFPGDPGTAYALHTTDGGHSWVPEAISPGTLAGLAATDATHAYALVGPPDSGGSQRELFFTGTGGAAGSPSSLRIAAVPPGLRKKALRRTRGLVTISGTLAGAVGGERVAVSGRQVRGGGWATQVVTVGANGGSFSARFRIHASEVFVAQWAGDSGRAGAATRPLLVKVR